MKKLLALVLAVLMVLSLSACGGAGGDGSSSDESKANSDIKVGFIYIGDENEGYTASHYEGAKAMKEELGLSDDQIVIKWNIPESTACYDAAVDLAEEGCDIIFANSFGHEDYMIQAASEYPDIQFCHATGYKALSSGLDNMHNYFTSIYEARYLSGVVAGMKLTQMIQDGTITAEQAKIGYVGAYPYAEVISGFTAFYLGAKSVCPSATMEVTYTNSWFDIAAEGEAAKALIADDCVMIGQHADSTGAPAACEEAKTYCVGYNISMLKVAPNYALTSSTNNWAPYLTYAVKTVIDGGTLETDWCKGFSDGSVDITELNENAVAPGTKEKVEEVKAAIIDGSLKVFTGPLNGKGVDFDGNEVTIDLAEGEVFEESDVAGGKGSAPAWNYIIDGITVKG